MATLLLQFDFILSVCYHNLATKVALTWGRFGFDGNARHMVSEPQFGTALKSEA